MTKQRRRGEAPGADQNGAGARGRAAVEALIARGRNAPMQATDYDTSWALRLAGPDGQPEYPHLARRLVDRQRADGSWGGQIPHPHDRLLTTLSVVIALSGIDGSEAWGARTAGEHYLRAHLGDLGPESDRTIGFELIFPSLLEEASALGLDLPFGAGERLKRERAAKLALLPEDIFSSHTTALFSLEAFRDDLDVEGAARLLLENGSMANSPSATASLMGRIPNWRGRFPASAAYLDLMLEGPDPGLPAVYPCDIFVPAWTLYYLQHGGLFEENRDLLRPYLDHLERTSGRTACGSPRRAARWTRTTPP